MKCEKTEKLISAYLDRELSRHLETAVKRHIDECTACFAVFQQQEQLNDAFSRAEWADPPEGFVRRVRLAAEGKSVFQAASGAQMSGRPMPFAVRIAACIMVFAGFALGALLGIGAFTGNSGTYYPYEGIITEHHFSVEPGDEFSDTYLSIIGYRD